MPVLMVTPDPDPRLLAGVQLLERSGAREFQLRYQDDEEPTVWLAVARWALDARGRPTAGEGLVRMWKTGSALNPLAAVLALCDDAIDGGECQHCGRPTGLDHDFGRMPLEDLICWYAWDPELATFRRACEDVIGG